MKNRVSTISGPDELDKRLQSTSFMTWLILGIIALMLVGLFVWASVYKLKIRLTGKATITSGVATLTIKDGDLSKLKEGQLVYIDNQEGKILSFNEDKTPVVSSFTITDGIYDYTIIIGEKTPISFVFGN